MVQKGLEIAALFPGPFLHFLKQARGPGKLDLRRATIRQRILHLPPGIQSLMGIAIPPDPLTGILWARFEAGQFLRCCHNYPTVVVILELTSSRITLGQRG